MSLVSTEDRGAVRLIVYANAPFGTMTAADAAEMFGAVEAASKTPSVRVIVITTGVPGIFIRHYDVGELSDAADRTAAFGEVELRRLHPEIVIRGFRFVIKWRHL